MLYAINRKTVIHQNNNKTILINHGGINKNFYLSRHRKKNAIRKNHYYTMLELHPDNPKTNESALLTSQPDICNINQTDNLDISILIIEDDRLNQKVISTFLKELKYRKIDIVDSGNKALTLLAEHAYGLILLDIGLPDINGIDLCKQIRNIASYKNSPIIAITAYENSEIEHPCSEVGIKKILKKPISIIELKESIVSCFE